jgi:hypothetical protein
LIIAALRQCGKKITVKTLRGKSGHVIIKNIMQSTGPKLTRTQRILLYIILGTIPLYLIGLGLLWATTARHRGGTGEPTLTGEPTNTLTATLTPPTLIYFSSPTVTATPTITQTPTVTLTATMTNTIIIPPTETPTATITQTITETATETSIPTETLTPTTP